MMWLKVSTNMILNGVILNLTILPLFDYNITVVDSLLVSLIFTVISVVRGYLIRRFFNSKERKYDVD